MDKSSSRIPDVLHLDHDSLDLSCTLGAQGKGWTLPSHSVSRFLFIVVISRDIPIQRRHQNRETAGLASKMEHF